jgi:glycosyltransferase involved in cell wall biosynthesis
MDEVVAFLARRLPAAGLEVAVLHAPPAPAEPGRLARALTDEGVLVVDGRPDTTPAWLETWLPDVISAHGAAPWVLPSARRLGVPYVDTFHGMHDLFGIDWTAEASRSAELDAVVTVSELIRTQYVTGNPSMDPSRVVSIPNAVDDHRHRPADRGAARRALGLQDEFLWVCLARYALQKNTYGLLRAFDRVARQLPEAHLVVAGRGDEPVYVQQVVNLQRRLESADRVHLRDHCPAPAVLLAAADGFVLDSFFEGWALSSMEALFAGLPVVVSEVGGAHEQVGADGSRGRVVRNPAGPPDAVDWPRMRELRYAVQPNESELVEAMVQITRAAPYWASRRAALQAESAARFDADDCVDRHAEVLRAVVHRSRRTGVPTTPGGGE